MPSANADSPNRMQQSNVAPNPAAPQQQTPPTPPPAPQPYGQQSQQNAIQGAVPYESQPQQNVVMDGNNGPTPEQIQQQIQNVRNQQPPMAQ